MGSMAGSCEHGNEPLDSIKGGRFQLLKKKSAVCQLVS
jgi:hypothetical protein